MTLKPIFLSVMAVTLALSLWSVRPAFAQDAAESARGLADDADTRAALNPSIGNLNMQSDADQAADNAESAASDADDAAQAAQDAADNADDN